MLDRLFGLAAALAQSACSVVGIRTYEEPPYRVLATPAPGIEVRAYGPRAVAEVTLAGMDDHAFRAEAFRRLARYIFGANAPRQEIAMTAPVQVASRGGQDIAMTAPVVVAAAPDGTRTMCFILPAALSAATAPVPADPSVRIATLPAETLAVLRFSGATNATRVAQAQRDLLAALAALPWQPAGTPIAQFYDPPFTPPPLRRNEVAVAVAPKSPPG